MIKQEATEIKKKNSLKYIGMVLKDKEGEKNKTKQTKTLSGDCSSY